MLPTAGLPLKAPSRLSSFVPQRFSEDEALIDQLLECMRCSGADFTATFRRLSLLPAPPTAAAAAQVEGAGREGAEGSGAVGGGKSERGGAEGGAGKGSGGAEETRRAVEEWGGRWVDEVLSECPGAEELAASMGAKLPLSAIQGMLTMAGRDPHLMHALGMSREMLEEELRRAEEAEEVRERGEGHRGWCRERWLEWLGAYMERLGMEAVVGATEEGRRRVMEKR